MSNEHSSIEIINSQFEQNYAVAQEFLASPQEFLDRLVAENPDGAEKCFNAAELQICCIDGRLRSGNLAIAGSGCLHQMPIEAIEFAKSEALSSGQVITDLTSHEGCGAAAMKDIDAVEFSKNLAQSTNLNYGGHLSVHPSDFHDEVVVYYSGNKSIALQELPGLPVGFRLSRRFYPNTVSAVYEAEVATQIACGEHGFGSRFNSEKPLIIVALGDGLDTQYSSHNLAQELSGLASDRIKIIEINYEPNQIFQELPAAA